jgi:hypothetical protein
MSKKSPENANAEIAGEVRHELDEMRKTMDAIIDTIENLSTEDDKKKANKKKKRWFFW